MPKVRVVRHRRKHPDDPIVMEIGEPAPPGTPVGETCWLPFEQIKHLLPADFRLARPGDPWPPREKGRRAKRGMPRERPTGGRAKGRRGHGPS